MLHITGKAETKDSPITAHTPQECASQFTAALLRRDIDAALALLAEEVVLFFSNETTIVGKANFATMMQAGWAVIENYKYESAASDWITQTDATAALIYKMTWSGVVRGTDVGGTGRGTRVFAKQADGRWLMTHEHISNGAWKA